MSVKYFKCKRCGKMYVHSAKLPFESQCGSFMGFKNDSSGSLVPYGCGGILTEISQTEAEFLTNQTR